MATETIDNPSTIETPSQSIIDDISSLGDNYILRVLNNDTTTFVEVIVTLMMALPCDEAYAQSCAIQIDALGSSEVMKCNYTHCEQVQNALKLIRVQSEILPEIV